MQVEVRTIQLSQDLCSTKCLSGWAYYNFTCLQVISTPVIWFDAELHCQNLVPRSHLVSIHSEENNNFVLNLLQMANITFDEVWLGSSNFFGTDVEMWTDGSKWDYYNWLEGKPVADLNCNAMKLQEDPGFWSDNNCDTNQYPFICMYPIEYD
ncbi:lectin-like [Mustelus asterias]